MSVTVAETGNWRRMFGALRQRDYRWWFASQVLAASGTMTQAIAMSWLVLQLTGDAVSLALLTICSWAPVLPVGPWAGALVDRVDRRRLLLLTTTLLLALAATLAVLTGTGTVRLWMLFALSLVTGTVGTVDATARQVYVVDLVGTTGVASAVSLYEVVINASRVLGPAVGGVLLSTVGITPCFAVNAATFVAPLLVLLRNRRRTADPVARMRRERGAIVAGLRYVAHSPVLLVCMLMAAASGMLFNLGITLPVFTTRSLHLGGGGFGLMMAMFGVGALPGAAFAAMTTWPTGRRVRLLCALTGLAVLAVAVAPSAWLAFVAMAVAGFTSIWFIAVANTLVQLSSDASLRGRVMGVWAMALPGTLPLTSLITAWAVDAIGPRSGFATAGVALLLAAAAGWVALGRHTPGDVVRPRDSDERPDLVTDG